MPWYKDWQFWAIIPAVIAILLSQLPPLRLLVRRSRVTMHVYQTAMLNHFIGAPIVQLYATVKNEGGKVAHISKFSINVVKDGKVVFASDADTYFDSTSAKNSVLFVPIDLQPEQHWSHLLNFGTALDRQEQRKFEAEKRALREDITEKYGLKKKEDSELTAPIEADEKFVTPLRNRFEKWFVWRTGEYNLVLTVVTDAGIACEQTYRFTVFEGDEAEQIAQVDGYATGNNILFGLPTSPINVPLEIKT